MIMRVNGILLALMLAGCVSSPLLPSAGDDTSAGSLASVNATVAGRARAPFTTADAGDPGATYGIAATGSGTGRPSAITQGTLMVDLGSGRTRLSGTWVRPELISGIAQRYSNDCAQASLATALGFLGLRLGNSTYQTLIDEMPPTQLGTRLEDAVSYLQSIPQLAMVPMRQSSMERLQQLIAAGKPVPVVVTLSAPSMHYSLVMGTGSTPDGRSYVLLKDPSQEEASAFLVLPEADFLAAWENSSLRLPVIGWIAGFVSHTNADNYQRVALDLGLAP